MSETHSKLRKGWPKDAFRLIPELLWVIIAFVPMLLLALFENLAPHKKSLKGEVALITGAGNGLGRELALRLAKRGCKLALVDINGEAVQNVAKEINQEHENMAKSYVANVGKPQDIKLLGERILSDFGRVDVLINNAGLVHLGRPFLSLQDQEIDAMFRINVISHFTIIREFLDGMLKRNHGHVVGISSVSSYVGVSNGTVYASTKWALTGMMESLRAELQSIPNNRVKLSVACPYFISTNPVHSLSETMDLRIPPISVGEAAKAVIDGIKREKFEFSIPSHFSFSTNFLKLLPEKLKDMFTSIFYCRIRAVPDKKVEDLPNTKILETLINKASKSDYC